MMEVTLKSSNQASVEPSSSQVYGAIKEKISQEKMTLRLWATQWLTL